MPVPKKPRRNTSSKAAAKPAGGTDRRTMEAILAALGGGAAFGGPAIHDPIAKAQELMYDAWEKTTSRGRIAGARRALEVSPLCADAYVLLAQEAARSPEEARDFYAQGVAAGARALGKKGFKEYAGHFWGFLETRPYMRARAGLATTLRELGDIDGAIGHYREMLVLNPGDNQGIRYALLACLLHQDAASAVNDLLADYPDEWSAFWLYTRALVAFRSGEKSEDEMAALVRDAMEANEHVPAILAGTKPAIISSSGYLTVGGPDEATDYISECGSTWRGTPGAVEWLAKTAASRLPKRKAQRAAH